MLFCPKCGGLLVPKDKKMHCPKCGFKSKETETTEIKEKVKQEKDVEVVEKETEAYPLVDQECPKCGHKKAYFWEIQTRAGDEPATQFFKCEKCKHTWRKY
jgi:DNA-directed RNA polymerase subunit M